MIYCCKTLITIILNDSNDIFVVLFFFIICHASHANKYYIILFYYFIFVFINVDICKCCRKQDKDKTRQKDALKGEIGQREDSHYILRQWRRMLEHFLLHSGKIPASDFVIITINGNVIN